jgi:GT2 family glycosyltransferase
VVGSVRQDSGTHAYGGVERPLRWRRTRFVPVLPAQHPRPCETMNGNCVLIPRAVAATLGNLDAGYVHSMGDTDYGLRARRAGFEVHVAPGYFGLCNHNTAQGSFLDPQIGWRKRFSHLVSAKTLPPRAWLLYTRRHAGFAWPIYFVWPYIRQLSMVAPRTPRPTEVDVAANRRRMGAAE